MRIVRKLEELQEEGACSLALGTFDGIHPGHRAVISAAQADSDLEPGVFTFSDSPSGSPALMTREDKETMLEEMGVRRLYTFAFSALRDVSAEDFVRDVLFQRCRARRLCCGEDFRFGRGAAGDVSLLQRLCQEAGAELVVVPNVTLGGEKLSSTRIRAAVGRGDIPLANRLLGRAFSFSLPVIHGRHLGTGLGTPTINQAMPEDFALPPFGVYASWVKTGGGWYYGVTNIGVKPTVGSDRVLAETWLPDFSGDLYGQRVRVCLLEAIRPERKFPSLEALKEEIRRNAVRAKEIAKQTSPARMGL